METTYDENSAVAEVQRWLDENKSAEEIVDIIIKRQSKERKATFLALILLEETKPEKNEAAKKLRNELKRLIIEKNYEGFEKAMANGTAYEFLSGLSISERTDLEMYVHRINPEQSNQIDQLIRELDKESARKQGLTYEGWQRQNEGRTIAEFGGDPAWVTELDEVDREILSGNGRKN